MIRAQSQITINRPVEDVFKFVSVDFFHNYPRWSPEVIRLEKLSAGEVGVGTTAKQVRCDEGRRSESTFRVYEYEAARIISFESITKPKFIAKYGIERRSNQTQLVFTFEVKPDLLTRAFQSVIGHVLKRGTQRAVLNIKNLLETSPQYSDCTARANTS